ncbi:MAG: alanine dehydrogenase [Sphingobium sp.]
MLVGVPKEIKVHEYRVGLTPGSVREMVAAGHQVLVERGAGAGIGMDDDSYIRAGATVAGTAAEVFARADMIVKVKEPQPSEWSMLRPDQILFTYLHLAPDPEQARGLMRSGCSAIAYETIVDTRGSLPLLAPMSEVAGRLSIEAAGAALRRHAGGSGILLGGVPGVSPSRIVVIGGGVVGTHAARIAVGMGAQVTIIDASLPRLRQLDELFEGRVRTRLSTLEAIEQEISEADAVIGAVLIPGESAPKLIKRPMLSLMKRNAVLVDVAIDQGGCFETSRPTTHDEPTYVVDGIIHYCVANMPGAVPRTSSYALNNATLPYALALANRGLAALDEDAGFHAGLNIHRGEIVNASVAHSLAGSLEPAAVH